MPAIAHELSADLKDFSSPPGVFRFVSEHRRAVREPLRNGIAGQTHADRSCDLCRGVRSQKERPSSRSIDELVAGLQQFGFETRSKHIEVFKRGKNNLIVAPVRHMFEQLRLDPSDLLGGMRQNRRHPDGDERTLSRRENVPRR